MTTCPQFETESDLMPGFVEMHPGAHRAAAQAIAEAAARAGDAKVYSLIARRAAAIDLEAEFAAFADEAAEWAAATFAVDDDGWPAE